MDVSEARLLRALEDEPGEARSPAVGSPKGEAKPRKNARLKRIIADLSVQNHILKEVNSKKW
jgi:hypothetical protein